MSKFLVKHINIETLDHEGLLSHYFSLLMMLKIYGFLGVLQSLSPAFYNLKNGQNLTQNEEVIQLKSKVEKTEHVEKMGRAAAGPAQLHRPAAQLRQQTQGSTQLRQTATQLYRGYPGAGAAQAQRARAWPLAQAGCGQAGDVQFFKRCDVVPRF